MAHKLAAALVLLSSVAPVFAQEPYSFFWDRYATNYSQQRVDSDSATTSFYRNRFAVNAATAAQAPADVAARTTTGREQHDGAMPRHDAHRCTCKKG